MIRVLFVCVHNSARSQMAEAFLNHLGGQLFKAESAGLEPGTLNPIVVEVMREVGIDISHNETKGVFDFFKMGRIFEYVVTVCDAEAAERCPIFPGVKDRISWSFSDPAAFHGSHEEVLRKTREVRDEIRASIQKFIAEVQQD